MALSPKERADFDEIVTRLRLEDAHVGEVAPKRRSTTLLVSLIAAVLVVGLGVALVSDGVLGPILVICASVACVVLIVRRWARSRRR
ncbi:DUF3040 domain-containing protein [Pseudonocardia acaciae]|uniref:DUF3040 domain-containing protein n=1 Tax=Pseudonocardia acaciae TaxID=551276 RepID=UPI00049117B7|nr:DUF3040 domain-containing protein [Pseudonocardia acaciae]